MCVCVCVCVCVGQEGERLTKTTFRFVAVQFFFPPVCVCVCACVLRGSEIRGAAKSFLTLSHTLLLVYQTGSHFLFFLFFFFFSDFVCRASASV